MGFGNAAEFAIVMKLVDEVSGGLGGIGDKFGTLGQGLSNTGKKMTAGLTLPILGAGAAALKMASDFDGAMRNVNSIAQLPEEQFAKLKKDVIDFSLTTRASSADVAGALYNVVSAGFDAGEAFDVMKQASRAAGAGLASTEDTSKLLIAAMRTYGYGVEDAADITDIFLQTVNQGITTLPELASGLGRILPQASNLGVSLEEVGFSLAQMTQSGLSTDEAVTRLNQVFVSMVKPSEALKGAISELGYASGTELVEQSGGALAALSQLQQAGLLDTNEAVAELFPNLRAMGGVLALINNDAAMASGGVEAFGEAAEGAVERAREQQYMSLGAQIAKLKSAFEAIAIAVGDQFVPVLVDLVKQILPFIHSIGQADPLLIKIGTAFAGVLAVLGPLLIVLGSVVSAMGTLASVVLSPLALVIAGVVAGFLALKLAFDNNLLGFKDFVQGITEKLPTFDDLKNAFEVFKETGDIRQALEEIIPEELMEKIDGIIERFGQFRDLFADWDISVFRELMEDMFGEQVADILTNIVGKFEEFANWASTASEWLAPLIEAIQEFGFFSSEVGGILEIIFGQEATNKIGAFAQIMSEAWTFIQEAISIAWEIIQPAIEEFWTGIKSAFDNLQPVFEQFKSLWASLGPFITAIAGVIGAIIATVVGVVISLFSGIARAIEPFLNTVFGVIKGLAQAFQGVVEMITGFLQLIWGLITRNEEMVTKATEKLKQGVTNLWEGLKTAVITAVTGLVDTVVALVSGFYESIVKWFTDLYNKIVGQSIVTDLVDGIINAFTGFVEEAVRLIEDFVGDVIDWFDEMKRLAEEKISDFIEIGTGIIDGIKEGAAAAWQTFLGWLREKFDMLPQWAKDLIGMASPAKKFMIIGQGMVEGIAAGFKDGEQNLYNVIDEVLTLANLGAEKKITPEAEMLGRKWSELLAKGMGGAAVQIVSEATGIVYNITDATLDALEELGIGLHEAIDSIESYWENAGSIFGGEEPIANIPPPQMPPGWSAGQPIPFEDVLFDKYYKDADFMNKLIRTFMDEWTLPYELFRDPEQLQAIYDWYRAHGMTPPWDTSQGVVPWETEEEAEAAGGDTFVLNASYSTFESESTLLDDVRLLQILSG